MKSLDELSKEEMSELFSEKDLLELLSKKYMSPKVILFPYDGPSHCAPNSCPMFEPEIHTNRLYAGGEEIVVERIVRCKNREICGKILDAVGKGKITIERAKGG